MKFYGIQKLTLLDFPGKVACTLFTGGCNFRCPFCHNSALVEGEAMAGQPVLEETEVLSFLNKRRGVLDGICITGGEPLLQPEIELFIQKCKALGYQVKLDTNGSFPQKLKALVCEGLVDYVAMDVKNAPSAYGATVGIENFDIAPVRESIGFLQEGNAAYEFRTTVVRQFHNTERMVLLSQWIQGASPYYIQNFRDSGRILKPGLSGFSREELEAFLQAVRGFLPKAQLRAEA